MRVLGDSGTDGDGENVCVFAGEAVDVDMGVAVVIGFGVGARVGEAVREGVVVGLV